MFFADDIPILYNLPTEFSHADVYFIHDLHYGSELFNKEKWKSTKAEIQENDRAIVCWVGDLFENAIPNSKSDMFKQTCSPAEQKEFVTRQFCELKDKTLAVVSGNHCSNRTTKVSGMYPLYDCCLIAGIGEKYRDTIAFLDIGVGLRRDKKRQVHYFGQIQHRSKDVKSVCSADYTDGIDFFAFGHDHEPKDRPRAKLVFDPHNKTVYKRNIEVLNCGSFCDFGGYGAKSAYRPQSDKMYKLRLFGDSKRMETTGFYL